MPLVGAGLGGDIDYAARGASELGRPAGGDHLEFADDVFAIKRPGESCRVVVGGEAVNNEVVVEVALAGDRNPGTRNGGGLGELRGSTGIGPGNAGYEEGEVHVVAAVERQRFDVADADNVGGLSADGLERGLGGIDLDRLAHTGEAEDDREVDCLAYRNGETAYKGLKAGRLDGQRILARIQVKKLIATLGVADHGFLLAARWIADRDDRGRHRSPGGVLHAAAERNGGLRGKGRGKANQDKNLLHDAPLSYTRKNRLRERRRRRALVETVDADRAGCNRAFGDG